MSSRSIVTSLVGRRSQWSIAIAGGTFLLLFPAVCLAHPAVLPAPQEIQEGSGRFLLSGARICFASSPSTEDSFAARALAAALMSAASSDLPIGRCTGRHIVFKRTGNGGPVPLPGEQVGKTSREAYAITVTPQRVMLESSSSAGLFYAATTLAQLVEKSPEPALAEAVVHDWPALAYRGFMMDMSHAQLPKMDELKQQIDFLASWKINQYLFYSEASIALDGFPVLEPNATFSKAQVKELIDYARERHMDVIANVELYGHLHDMFRLERYADMAVIPHGGEFRRDDPRVKPLLTDWITQLAQLFPSKFFHVGFDETFLLEKEAERLHRSPGDVYLEQLQTVIDLLAIAGKTPMAWADMMEKYPQIIPKLPKNLIVFPWHYEPLKTGEYDRLFTPFREAGQAMIVQSAVMNWNWLVPDFHTSFENDQKLLTAGLKFGAIGFVNSGWTDDTQVLMRMTRPALAHGGIAAWQGVAPDPDRFFAQYTAAIYPTGLAPGVAKGLEQLDRAETLLQAAQGSGTINAMWANPFAKDRLRRTAAHRADLHQCRLAAEQAAESLQLALHENDAKTIQAFLVGSRLLDYTALKYLYADEIAGFWQTMGERPSKNDVFTLLALETASKYHSRTSDMLDGISALRDDFQAAWLAEYTPFRLTLALGKYDGEFQFWWRFQRRAQALAAGFHDGDALPPLETLTGSDQ